MAFLIKSKERKRKRTALIMCLYAFRPYSFSFRSLYFTRCFAYSLVSNRKSVIVCIGQCNAHVHFFCNVQTVRRIKEGSSREVSIRLKPSWINVLSKIIAGKQGIVIVAGEGCKQNKIKVVRNGTKYKLELWNELQLLLK